MTGSEELKIVSALDYVSGTADRNGATVDTHGYEGVLIIVKTAAIAAGGVNSIKAQQAAISDFSDGADLLGSRISIADDDDNQSFVIDLVKPQERYVRVVIDKDGTNAMAEMAWYVLYGAHKKPVVNAVVDAVTIETHVSPAEGTA